MYLLHWKYSFTWRLKIFSYLNHHFSLTTSIRKNMLLALIIQKVYFYIFCSLFDSWKKTIKSTFHIFYCIKIKFLCFICISICYYDIKYMPFLNFANSYIWLIGFQSIARTFHRKEREGFEELNFSIEGI